MIFTATVWATDALSRGAISHIRPAPKDLARPERRNTKGEPHEYC